MTAIKVWPASDAVRKYVRHPSGGVLKDDPAGTSWPADQFTFRRIADGDVLTEAPQSSEPPAASKVAASKKPPQPAPGEA